MPEALAVGCPYDLFFHLTPKELESFFLAHKLRRKQIDEESWLLGSYFLSAVSTALDHAFNGRKAHSEYIKQPFLSEVKVTDGLQTEEQKREAEERLRKLKGQQVAAMLDVMMHNFNMKKALKEKKRGDNTSD